jgi:lysophospholipase L1-like esterase
MVNRYRSIKLIWKLPILLVKWVRICRAGDSEIMAILFQPRQKLLFIGDSITDAGRSQFSPYGNGFVRDCCKWLQARYPELNLTIINRGVSGDTVLDLLYRWERDVIRLQPDWLFIKVGINDVWLDLEGYHEQGVGLAEFNRHYRRLIEQASHQTRAQIILIEPFLVEDNPADMFRRLLAAYQEQIAELAEEQNLSLVKLQQAFDQGLTKQPAEYWAEDRVHPTPVGHALIARHVLQVCGFEPTP